MNRCIVFLSSYFSRPQNLWNLKYKNVERKVSKSVGIIYKSSSSLIRPPYVLTIIIVQFVLIYITRCECLGLNLSVKSKLLITLQKRVNRIISRSPFDAHANPIFASLRILKFEGIVKLQKIRLCIFTKTAFFLIVLMTCFYSTVTNCKFSLRFQGPKIFNFLGSAWNSECL